MSPLDFLFSLHLHSLPRVPGGFLVIHFPLFTWCSYSGTFWGIPKTIFWFVSFQLWNLLTVLLLPCHVVPGVGWWNVSRGSKWLQNDDSLTFFLISSQDSRDISCKQPWDDEPSLTSFLFCSLFTVTRDNLVIWTVNGCSGKRITWENDTDNIWKMRQVIRFCHNLISSVWWRHVEEIVLWWCFGNPTPDQRLLNK